MISQLDEIPAQVEGLPIYLRLPDVLRVFPVSRSTWYEGVQNGVYPRPVKLGKRTSAWRSTDIKKLIEKCDKGEI